MEDFYNDLYSTPLEKTVRKSNELIQKSRFNLSLQQQKIILFLISQISPYDTDFKTFNFDIREFCRVCGIDYDNGGNYELLKKQIKAIRDESVWISLNDEDETDTLFNWIEKARIKKKSGVVQIRLDEDLKPYLLQLRQNFTKYEIIYTLNFKSKYTIRLYELIKSIHYQETEKIEYIFSLDNLKRLTGAENYKTFQHFKDRVLKVAVKEINQYSDKTVSFEPISNPGGKRVQAIKFYISTKSPAETAKITGEIAKNINYNQMVFDGFDGIEY